jgi:processive rubber oxygenase RoxA-like protein
MSRVWLRIGVLAIAASAAALSFATMRSRAAAAPLSREALAEHFDAGLRNVVVEWDRADARTDDERRRALFEFVYETYRASAWIPQSLFDGNVATQIVAGDVDTIVGRNVGLVLWRDNPRVRAFGMAPNAGSGEPLRWTVNCLVCHTAEIDGVVYFGAGTKTFDERWLGDALRRLTAREWRTLARGRADDDAIAADAHRILTAHHHDRIDSLTRARSTAFAASHVEMFLRTHAGEMPAVGDVGRGDVKTPPLWHTAAKMPARRWYTDGSFHGRVPLMASSMELEKDRPFDALARDVIPIIKDEFEGVVRHLRPPKYPYAIDRALAERGRALFYSSDIGCYRCHGTYDRGRVDWPGVHVSVGTDRGRLDVVRPQFVEAFDRSPLAAEGSLRPSRGYAATPLTGVWANFPYLHNGSVPTLHHLLGPASDRPRIFHVTAAATLDRVRVGQPLAEDPKLANADESDLVRRFGDDRDWFNTARPGCANVGHDFWPLIKTDENRRALIEYLKTL